MEDRFKTLLRSQVFQEIRRCEDDDNILSKVVPILGDVILPELGFSKDDSAMLKASVSVVFHAAANIKFSTGLKDVMAVNCGGTRNMIEWAKLLPNLKFDLVPVDQVVNLIIAAAVRLSVENKSKMMVYNYSSTEHPFLCSESQSALLEAYAKNPMDQLFWYPSVMFIRNTKVFAALDFFLHFLPALITDTVGFILGKERRMLSIYNKLQRAIAATKEIQRTYFSISTNNTKDLYNLLQEDDQILFNFNIRDVNIRKYFQDLHYGIKFYVLKEKHEDLKNARGNFER
ncbi:unnamed protein product [Allacma fusca]|uniref:Fatty acyl-CoA reductase n=1 Tax=Allacma fusca TaxID=39272 RepID=A0A8J2NXF6_9HEXA|nr:unnamed protein product [Allacma fusca]